jgi:2-methylcitrate dehydratase
VAVHWGGLHAIGGGAGDHDEKWDPQTREVADHSMAYLVAVALVDGDVTVDSFSEARISDPALRPLMQKIVVIDDPELTAEHAGELPRWPSRVELLLKDGRRLGRASGPPKGHPSTPWTITNWKPSSGAWPTAPCPANKAGSGSKPCGPSPAWTTSAP